MSKQRFRNLHQGPGILLLPNAWDGVSARLIQSLGAKAIATTSAGVAWFKGVDLLALEHEPLRAMREHLQIIFQDPLASLDPRMRVAQIIEEPLLEFRPKCGAQRLLADAGTATGQQRLEQYQRLARCLEHEAQRDSVQHHVKAAQGVDVDRL